MQIRIITKERAGKVKRRMILDACASSIKECSQKGQRVVLPELLDAIMQALALLSLCEHTTEESELFALDFVEAFWQVPLHPEECKFFCAQIVIS